jgi:hypothetical protein
MFTLSRGFGETIDPSVRHDIAPSHTRHERQQPIVDINGQDLHKMRPHGGLKEEEANDAAWEAGRGAMFGAARVFSPTSSAINFLKA